MDTQKKQARYDRIYKQLTDLLTATEDKIAKMATINAILYHKMDYFFWTGFYLHRGDILTVGPYQGPVACQELKNNSGVCWAAFNQKKTVVVEDVEQFPGHIACDSRSKSEITVPVYGTDNNIKAILDVDARELAQFDDTDATNLNRIAALIYRGLT